MDGNEERRERLGRSGPRPESTGDGSGSENRRADSSYDRSYDDNRDGSRENRDIRSTGDDRRNEERGTIDRLIDQAQEKGYFDKAERFFRDKFGGGKGGSGRR